MLKKRLKEIAPDTNQGDVRGVTISPRRVMS